jgi:DNA repair protein RecN (Recombination protein N)
MLWNLYIENIAVAKQLEIQFEDGFSVITGKTGAGKSIILDSILLLCGAKNARELIRSGEERASVSGIFRPSESAQRKLSDLGYPADENGEIQIVRQITSDGRSAVKINRKPAPLSVLREISEALLEIQTQSERSSLEDKSTYLPLLDTFSENEAELAAYREKYDTLTATLEETKELKAAMTERETMLDVLRYQKKEIDSAKLTADDEEEKLLKLRTKLKSIERVSKYSSLVTRALASSEKGATAAYLLEKAEAALMQLSDVVEDAEEMAAKLANYRYEIIDIAERVSDAMDTDGIANPEEKLTQIESRLSQIDRLKKKYGNTISEIKQKKQEIADKIAALEEGDVRLDELKRKLQRITAEAADAARKISEKRVSAADKLSAEIVKNLKFLDMPKDRFKISVTPRRDAAGEPVFRADGYDDVDFLISVNSGEDIQSISKVSSGGELSRITLAIKTVLADRNGAGTLIFDEIDTGVSGGTAERIGIMLEKLSHSAQIISITHSPQIASIAKHHLLVTKNEANERTESTVSEIFAEERIAEIARIIGGISITEKQNAAAREMLVKYDNYNN